MKKLKTIIKWILIIWGAVSALGTIVAVSLIIYFATGGTRNATIDQANVALNWSGLGANRLEEVVKSYESMRSFTGDHLDAYSIKVSHVTPDELQTDDWQRVDIATGVYKEAIDFMAMWLGDEIPWFPEIEDIRSDKYYVNVWEIEFHRNNPDSATIILARPEDNMVFYFEGVL